MDEGEGEAAPFVDAAAAVEEELADGDRDKEVDAGSGRAVYAT